MNMPRLRCIFSCLAICLGILCSSGQSKVFDNPGNRSHFGFRAGADITCPVYLKVFDARAKLYNTGAGFHFGVVYNIATWKNLYIEPGILAYYNSMGETGNYQGYKNSIRRCGFRVPLVLGYHFDFKKIAISVFTGPEVNFGIIGRAHVSRGDDCASKNIYGGDSEFSRYGYGWKFGAGITYGNYIFEVSGNVGTRRIYKSSNSSFYDNNVYLTLGYNF